jgi:hypothetical protein
MKSVKIVLRRRREGKRENDGGGKSKIYCKYICKYHKYPPFNYDMLIKFLKNILKGIIQELVFPLIPFILFTHFSPPISIHLFQVTY